MRRGSLLVGSFSSRTKLRLVVILCVLLCTCTLLLFLLCHHSTSFTPTPHAQFSFSSQEPSIAVAVIVSLKSEAHWNRHIVNSAGWLKKFQNVQRYTFDPINTRNISNHINISHVKTLFLDEHTGYNTNLHLAAYEQIAKISADWYLAVDDDTIVVPSNLKKLVRYLNPAKRIALGKCTWFDDSVEGSIPFNVGGAGVLMSRGLLQELVPYISECRRRYNRVYYGDARVGACISISLNQSEGVCVPNGYVVVGGHQWSFTNRNVRVEVSEHTSHAFVVTIHEKFPGRIRLLNEYVESLIKRGHPVTWRSLSEVMDADGY